MKDAPEKSIMYQTHIVSFFPDTHFFMAKTFQHLTSQVRLAPTQCLHLAITLFMSSNDNDYLVFLISHTPNPLQSTY